MQMTELPRYDAFYSKLRSSNPLEIKNTDSVNFFKKGLTTEQAVIKLKQSKSAPNRIENYATDMETRKNEHLHGLFAVV